MIRVIIFLVSPLFLAGLCQKVTNNHKFFLPNHQDCGLRSINSSDIRTLHPWTVAVYTRTSSRSPWQYFVTGALFSPTAVITVFGGGFGQPPPGDSRKKYKIPSAKNVIVVGGLTTTDLLEADINTQYAPVSYLAPCSNSSEPNDEDYHLVIIRLARPFDITTPYVRPACVPFFIQFVFENFGFISSSHFDLPGTMSGFYSPYGRGFYSKVQTKNGPTYASIFARANSYGGKRCANIAKFYYKARAEYLFCGRLLPDGLSNYTCMTHGTAGLWESTQALINLMPAYGPVPRFFAFGALALVPQRDKGLCHASSLFILATLRKSFDYIRGHLKCPPATFPCVFEDRCIELNSVCDGIFDCNNKEDEDPTFCRATSKCDFDKDEYQCGLYGKCIAENRTLDGVKDCPSGSDENPQVLLTLSRRKFAGKSPTPCYPLQLSEGVVANCAGPSGKPINCTNAVPGTDITLTCAPYYSPAQRAMFIKRNCYQDLYWKPVRSFSCETECGLWGTDLLSVGFIANGKQVEYATRFPWHALIFRETYLGSDDFEYICGGSLIEKNIIVTAAHCLVDARGVPVVPQMLKIVMNAPSTNFQENGKNEGTQIFQVEQFWHPWSFDVRNLISDIAIIHLKRPATYNNYVSPICYLLDKTGRPPAVNSTGKVPGFGLDENGELSLDLKFIELNVTKSDECGAEGSPNTFCAKAFRNGDSLCYGDSGGGIIFPAKAKRYGAHVLKGVVSTRKNGRAQCADGDSPTSFTHVDSFTEWILSTIEGIDTNPDS